MKKRSADEILEVIKQRQKEKTTKAKSDWQLYEEYRSSVLELMEMRQKYHELKSDITTTQAEIDGCYPKHFEYWFESELLEAYNNMIKDQQVVDLKKELKKRRDNHKDL